MSDALNHMVMCSEFQHDSLISRITALHIIHWNSKSQILCFGQLVSHSPSIMEKLEGVLPSPDFPEMVFCEHNMTIHTWMMILKCMCICTGAPFACCYEGDEFA